MTCHLEMIFFKEIIKENTYVLPSKHSNLKLNVNLVVELARRDGQAPGF